MNYAFNLIEDRSGEELPDDENNTPRSLRDEVAPRPLLPLERSNDIGKLQSQSPFEGPTPRLTGSSLPTLHTQCDSLDESVELADLDQASMPSNKSGQSTLPATGPMPEDRFSAAACIKPSKHADKYPHLASARDAFQASQTGIMGHRPPPGPAPKGSAVAAMTQQTVFSKLLAEHQREISRLQNELGAEKKRSEGLKRELERVAREGDGGGPAKRKKLGGRLTLP